MTNANRKRQLAVETAAKEGLRASVPLYVAAAEAFVQEDRPTQAVELLGELLRAKEKRRGLFAGVDKNPLGPERLRVAVKYSEIARIASPTEDSLELLEDLSVEFPDLAQIRRAHADGLRNAGYAADAIEEYRQCARLEPKEADIPVRLSELNAALGRTDEAMELLRQGIQLHAEAREYEQVADRAIRFIDLNPDGLDDVFQSFDLIPGDVLRKHVPALDHLGVFVRRDPSRPDTWRVAREQRLVGLYTRVLEADSRNMAARRGINVLGPQYLSEVEARLKAGIAQRAQAAQAAVTAAQATITAAPVRPAAPAPPPETETQAPELVEHSPGELIAEDVTEGAVTAAPPSAAPPKPATTPIEQAATRPAAPAQPAAPTPKQTQPQPLAAQTKPAPAQQPVALQAQPAAAQPRPTGQPVAAQVQPTAAPVQPSPTAVPPAAAPPPKQAAAPAQPTAPQPAAAAPAPAAATPSPAAATTAPAAAAPQPKPAAAPASAPSRALYAFALRKAQEQFDAGSYDEAAQACDRLLKRGEIAEVLQLLARCYIKLDRRPDAVQAGLRFAEAAAAENPAQALDSLTELIKQLPDPALILRRSQLLSSLRQVEFAAKDHGVKA